MVFQYIFQNSGLRLMHSTDLDDMRNAICDEGEDERGSRDARAYRLASETPKAA